MSEADNETTSVEDKFFGVKTQHIRNGGEQDSSEEESDLLVEVVDDTPPEQKRPPKKAQDWGSPTDAR